MNDLLKYARYIGSLTMCIFFCCVVVVMTNDIHSLDENNKKKWLPTEVIWAADD